MLSPEQVQEYLRREGRHCPYCGSEEVLGGEFQPSDSAVFRDCECASCGGSWTEEFTMTGITA